MSSGDEGWVPQRFEVENKVFENDHTATFLIKPLEEVLKPIAPGQFNMLYAFGKGEIPISVSSLLCEQDEIIHTVQNVGNVSKAIVNLQPGDQIGVRGPFGSEWPIDQAKGKDVVVIAGGVGLAPLRPVVEYLSDHTDEFNNISVLYGTRSPEEILFHSDIISWQSDPSVDFQITVDHAFRKWHGHIGVVTQLISMASYDPANTLAMVCGPEIMMRYAIPVLEMDGIKPENIYISMERNMKCAIGHCGHCQYGQHFVCKDGAVFQYPQLANYLNVMEL